MVVIGPIIRFERCNNAAIHQQIRPCDKSGIWAGKERQSIGDVAKGAGSTYQSAVDHGAYGGPYLRLKLLAQHGRGNKSWADSVEPNPLLLSFLGRSLDPNNASAFYYSIRYS